MSHTPDDASIDYHLSILRTASQDTLDIIILALMQDKGLTPCGECTACQGLQ